MLSGWLRRNIVAKIVRRGLVILRWAALSRAVAVATADLASVLARVALACVEELMGNFGLCIVIYVH